MIYLLSLYFCYNFLKCHRKADNIFPQTIGGGRGDTGAGEGGWDKS